MESFEFYNPVKILFGEGKVEAIAHEIPFDAVVMMTYGGGSIKKNGVYQQVMDALKGHKVVEFGGIEPNPAYETLMQAVELARSNGVTYLLAVGGGSVIDGTKFIAAAVPFSDDPWNLVMGGKKVVIAQALPIGTVLTLPATGSEMNSGAVISRKATKEKYSFGSPLLFPKFSVLDPTFTYSLPVKQVANGIIDAFIHVTEQYLTYPAQGHIQDRWAEGILQTLVEVGPQAIDHPSDYNVRANIMWSCTMALNGIIAVGVPTDWATHMIGHELTALFGLDHAVTLAIVLPSLLRVMRHEKKEKLVQFGSRVFGIAEGSDEVRAEKAIESTEKFFQSLGVKTRLRDYGITLEQVKPIVERFEKRGWKLGENRSITYDVVEAIFHGAL